MIVPWVAAFVVIPPPLLQQVKGLQTEEAARIAPHHPEEVIHRDDWVPVKQQPLNQNLEPQAGKGEGKHE